MTCKTCNGEFKPTRSWQKFCSEKCRNTFHNGLRLKTIAIIASMLALGTSAMAADVNLPVKAPYIGSVTGFNWSGIYFGGEAGYGFSAIQLGEIGTNSKLGTVTDPGSIGPHASGGVGGLTLAMRYQGGGSPWVFGVKAAADLTGINSNANPDFGATLASVAATGITAPAGSTSIPWDGRVGGEIGYSVLPNFLLFVDGGLAFGEIKMNTTAVNLAAPINQATIVANTNNVHTGWFAGLGAKYALSQNIILGAEWIYTDLGTQGVTLNGGRAAPATFFNVSDHAAYNKIVGTVELKLTP